MEMCNKQANVLQQAGSPITWIRLLNSIIISIWLWLFFVFIFDWTIQIIFAKSFTQREPNDYSSESRRLAYLICLVSVTFCSAVACRVAASFVSVHSLFDAREGTLPEIGNGLHPHDNSGFPSTCCCITFSYCCCCCCKKKKPSTPLSLALISPNSLPMAGQGRQQKKKTATVELPHFFYFSDISIRSVKAACPLGSEPDDSWLIFFGLTRILSSN